MERNRYIIFIILAVVLFNVKHPDAIFLISNYRNQAIEPAKFDPNLVSQYSEAELRKYLSNVLKAKDIEIIASRLAQVTSDEQAGESGCKSCLSSLKYVSEALFNEQMRLQKYLEKEKTEKVLNIINFFAIIFFAWIGLYLTDQKRAYPDRVEDYDRQINYSNFIGLALISALNLLR